MQIRERRPPLASKKNFQQILRLKFIFRAADQHQDAGPGIAPFGFPHVVSLANCELERQTFYTQESDK